MKLHIRNKFTINIPVKRTPPFYDSVQNSRLKKYNHTTSTILQNLNDVLIKVSTPSKYYLSSYNILAPRTICKTVKSPDYLTTQLIRPDKTHINHPDQLYLKQERKNLWHSWCKMWSKRWKVKKVYIFCYCLACSRLNIISAVRQKWWSISNLI